MVKIEEMNREEARRGIWKEIEGRIIYGAKVIIEGLLYSRTRRMDTSSTI